MYIHVDNSHLKFLMRNLVYVVFSHVYKFEFDATIQININVCNNMFLRCVLIKKLMLFKRIKCYYQ